MLVHDYDDEQTLEDEEMQEEGTSVSAEIADLEKEGNMPLEELLAMYRYEASIGTAGGSSVGGSSVELTDELPDMTLDKEEIAKDLLSGDDEETQSSADDLTPSVTSHETSDFFPRTLRCKFNIHFLELWNISLFEIMVGSQYQAEIPALVCYYDANEKVYENEDQLLWQPDALPEQTVKDFLHDTSALVVDGKVGPALESGLVQDNEQALYELVKCNYTVHDALEHYRRSEKSSEGEMPPWSEEECRNFELALLLYEKNFHLIQKHKVNTRTVAECVAFYYMWKKSERFDFFVQQNRFGKKKYSSYPGVTDLMDRLVDEAEGLVVDGSASVCSSSSGGRMEYSAEHQLNLLNSITASDLSALTSSVASVCNPSDVGCLESYSFPPLEGLHRGSLSHDESLGFIPNGAGDPDCINLLDAGFYHSDLGQLASCTDDYDRPPSKRLKMSLPETTVENVGLDYEARPRPITSTKMAVSVTDFGNLVTDEANGYIGTRPFEYLEHQHLWVRIQAQNGQKQRTFF
uniref:Mesoderm induction early response 1, family member 3 a n=1 Tax=Salmo trutta TaxID=8032 RepID=A0A674DUL7_SALTR